ncbi:MAG: hypothetical protein JW763_08105 [candidate division Zixibacteria bacterium]|nr:hypothetical protein [candidate division Zixibacteria bacterium]
MTAKQKEYLPVLLLSLVFVVLIFLLHHKWCFSMLSQTDDIWNKRLDIRMTSYPFSTRYFTNYATLYIHRLTSLSILNSFQVVQFTLLFLLGPALYRFLKSIRFSQASALLGLVVFYWSYPIASAFVQPVFTWDEFWTYLFVLLSFTYMFQGNLLIAVLLFIPTLYSRETAVFYYPILLAGGWRYCRNTRNIFKAIYLLLPLLAYLPFYIIIHGTHHSGMAKDPFLVFSYNFESFLRGSDSIFSFLVSFGFLWVAAPVGAWRETFEKNNPFKRFLTHAMLYLAPVTIALVFCRGFARETRMFFPPIVVILPLALFYLRGVSQDIRAISTRFRTILLFISFLLLIWLGIESANWLFPKFDYRGCAKAARLWLGVHFGLILCMAELSLIRKMRTYRASRSR